jgi:hypothetical protein
MFGHFVFVDDAADRERNLVLAAQRLFGAMNAADASLRNRLTKKAHTRGARIDPHGFDAGKLIMGKKRLCR